MISVIARGPSNSQSSSTKSAIVSDGLGIRSSRCRQNDPGTATHLMRCNRFNTCAGHAHGRYVVSLPLCSDGLVHLSAVSEDNCIMFACMFVAGPFCCVGCVGVVPLLLRGFPQGGFPKAHQFRTSPARVVLAPRIRLCDRLALRGRREVRE